MLANVFRASSPILLDRDFVVTGQNASVGKCALGIGFFRLVSDANGGFDPDDGIANRLLCRRLDHGLSGLSARSGLEVSYLGQVPF